MATPLKPDTTKSLGIKKVLKHNAYKNTPKTKDKPSKIVSLSLSFIMYITYYINYKT